MVAVVLLVTLRHSSETARAELAAADRQVISLLQDLSRVALLTDEFGTIQSFIEEARAESQLQDAALIDLSGMVVAASDPARIGTRLPDRERKSGWPEGLLNVGTGSYQLGWLALDLSDERLVLAYREAIRLGIAVAAVGMAVIALVGITIGHLLTRRLTRLAKVADEVSGGVVGLRARLAGDDEIARVGRAFDAMVDRLEHHLATVRLDRDRLILPTEAIHEGFALWDAGDRLVRCNTRLRELLGSMGSLLATGMSFAEFVRLEADQVVEAEGEALQPWLRHRLDQHRIGAAAQELGLRDGRWVRVSESRLPDGSAVSIYTEITEAKSRELALRASERRLQAIMNAVHEGIVTLDRNWRVEAVNPAAAAIFGLDVDSAQGLALDDFLVPAETDAAVEDDPSNDRHRHLVGAGPRDMVGKRTDGCRFPAEILISALEGKDGPAYIVAVRDVTSQKADRERILFHATHDPLTGLPNRRLLEDRLASALRHARRRDEMVAVALLDVDRFKSVNDSLGHAAGDELLVTLARRFTARLRESDTVARMGGDEFIFVLTGLREPRDVLRPAAKLLAAARVPMRVQGHELRLSASLGVSLFPVDGLAQEVLLKRADTALYRAKARGRNRCELFDQAMTAGTAARAALEAELAQACEGNQLLLLYQPQIDLHSGALLGFEALPRWQHPRRGLIGPEVFLPAAEQADLIGSVGLWILQRACRDLAQWQMADGAALRVAINIGQRQLQQEALPGQVQRVLSETGLRPDQLELELNETALLEEQGTSVQVTARLRALGIGLALDDFGTGYASLSHLRRYPVHRLKIHRSLIRDLARGGSDTALVRHLVGLAQELGLRVMAEGIETSEQLAVLRKLGCHEGQGHLLGHPVLAGEVPSLLVEAA